MLLAGWLLLVSAAGSMAEMAQIGKPFPSYTLEDQFGQTNTLSSDTRFVIVASEKDVSGKVNDWLKPKAPDFLAAHKAEYVSDIEPMPGIITTLFAMPKMKKYPFKLLLATEKSFAATYPKEKGRIALFILGPDQMLTDIRFVESPAEIEAVLIAGAGK
jgi:nitrous oxide reductase accessory protein NosL